MDKEAKQRIILHEMQGDQPFPYHYLQDFHLHMFCLRGKMAFVFNSKSYRCREGEFVFLFAKSSCSDVTISKRFKAVFLFVEKKLLDDNLPDLNVSIDAYLHSTEHPVLQLTDKADKQKVLLNFNLLHDKYREKNHRFYEEVLNTQMKLFILEMWHTFANEFEHWTRSMQSGTVYERFMLLAREHCMQQREVQFYAERLNVTPKYLNYISKQNTGITASEWIQRYVRERIILLLQNKNLNISEIADKMEFSSRSFFTRYVKKILGATPRVYRARFEN